MHIAKPFVQCSYEQINMSKVTLDNTKENEGQAN